MNHMNNSELFTNVRVPDDNTFFEKNDGKEMDDMSDSSADSENLMSGLGTIKRVNNDSGINKEDSTIMMKQGTMIGKFGSEVNPDLDTDFDELDDPLHDSSDIEEEVDM